MQAQSIDIKMLQGGKAEVIITTDDLQPLNRLAMIAATCDGFDVEIKKHREKRSLNANGMYWSFIGKLAEVLGISREEVHVQLLQDYGVHIYMGVRESDIDTIKASSDNKIIENLGKATVNGKEAVQLKVIKSSAIYNTKQFSKLLNGCLTEARDQGIPIIGQEEFDRLIEAYAPEKG